MNVSTPDRAVSLYLIIYTRTVDSCAQRCCRRSSC